MAVSAVYIANDLAGVERDRLHPEKRCKRPLASGAVSRRGALALLFGLYVVLGLGTVIRPRFMLVILLCTLVNFAYTFVLKSQSVIDIFVIAFVLRIYAGAVILQVPLSAWMFVTTFCLALFLASVKHR